jgi:hypothetical protein
MGATMWGPVLLPDCLQLLPLVLTLSSPLMLRLRAAVLAMLLVVLPLQGIVPLLAGLQGQRHVHTSHPRAVASPSGLRLLLDRLHAAQPVRLQHLGLAPLASRLDAQPHAHGSLVHTHGAEARDAVPVADSDEAGSATATAFLAWLPAPLAVRAAGAQDAPHHAAPLQAGRDEPPALMPPRA